MTLEDVFSCIEPFRRVLLSLLRPYEISKFLRATRCELSEWEQATYLNVLDDIFKDSSTIAQMIEAGMTVRILGSDIQRLQMRLKHPPAYRASPAGEFYLFVLVSDRAEGPNEPSTLVRDFRQQSEKGFVPDDFSLVELHNRFHPSVAEQIAAFSRWILCAPYLAGTMPNLVPGWIPLLNTRPHIHVRTYISTYNDCNGRFINMDHILMRQLFGYGPNKNLLGDLSNLNTVCMKIEKSGTVAQGIRGNFIISFRHNLLEEIQRRELSCTMSLSELPPELVGEILSLLPSADVLNFGITCSGLHTQAVSSLNKLARDHEHHSGYALTSGLQEVSFWFDRKGSGSILEWAAVKGQLQTFVRLLADPCMDLTRADIYGVTILHRLSGSGMTDFIKPLIERLHMLQMEIVPVDACHLTPLHYAAGRNRTGVVALLIQADVNMNARDNHGNTALHLAAVTGSCDVIPLLVRAGANVNAETRFGWTPIDQASITKHYAVVEILLSLGSSKPSWEVRENALGQFLSLSPCPIECYNLLNNERLYEDSGLTTAELE